MAFQVSRHVSVRPSQAEYCMTKLPERLQHAPLPDLQKPRPPSDRDNLRPPKGNALAPASLATSRESNGDIVEGS